MVSFLILRVRKASCGVRTVQKMKIITFRRLEAVRVIPIYAQMSWNERRVVIHLQRLQGGNFQE